MLKGVMSQMSLSSHDCYYITLQLSTGPHSSFRSRRFYEPKMLLDRDTNKLITKHERQALQCCIDKYKNQVHQEVHPSTVTSGAALAPLPRHCHAAPTQPPHPTGSHAGPTSQQPALAPPSRRSHVAPTSPQRC